MLSYKLLLPWLIGFAGSVTSLFWPLAAAAQEPQPQAAPLVSIKNHGRAILLHADQEHGVERITPPHNIYSIGRLELRVARPGAKPQAKTETAVSLADKVKARRLLTEANQAFFRGDLPRSWQLIDQAEGLNPHDHKILSMKGSLLFKTGSKDLAVQLWQSSLQQNPNQPDIAALLKQVQGAF